MDEKKFYLSEDMEDDSLLAEIDEALEAVEETVDDATLAEQLRADIRLLIENEKLVTKKLCLAKSKGLSPQIDQCRVLLQKVVAQKLKKQAELKEVEERLREAETKKFAAEFSEELVALTEHIERDVLGIDPEELPEPPSYEPMYDHLAKSKRLSVIAKALAFVGIFAGFIGALVYMLLSEFSYIRFNWVDLAIFGGVAVVMIVVGLFVGGASNRQARIAEKIAVEIAERQIAYEAELAELERIAAEKNAEWKNENADAVIEAYKIEKAGDAKRTAKKALQGMIPDLSNPDDVKKNARKLLPIAAAVATVATLAIASASKKSAANKKSAALRKEFFNWLT